MEYIMSPGLFNTLSNVRGFNDMNGNNYQQHINIIFDNRLNSEEKSNILNLSDRKALVYLHNLGIEFTHFMTEA